MSDINERYEKDVPHDPRSVELYREVARIDFDESGDYFCFKSGGQGDNGEHLMYLLDRAFELKDAAETAPNEIVEFAKRYDGGDLEGAIAFAPCTLDGALRVIARLARGVKP